LPEGPYDIVYADPPWWHYGAPDKPAAAGKHYRLMPTAEIAALPIRSIVARRAALFLWATGSTLAAGLEVMKARGFHHRGNAYVWVKTTRAGVLGMITSSGPTVIRAESGERRNTQAKWELRWGAEDHSRTTRSVRRSRD
jgi:N6-adenosine-specific RNA methylase IME4